MNMNYNFIELTRDNLKYFLDTPRIIIIFGSPSCGHCKKVLPKLKELSKKIPMVYVNALLYDKSITLYPLEIRYFPTIVYYEEGEYIKTLENKSLWKELNKIIKNN